MAYDIMSGFNVGQEIGGQSSLGEFVRQITQRAQSIQGLRLQAQAGGLAEEEKMKGMARFYQSPEGQGYIQSMGQLGSAMLNRIGGGVSGQGVSPGSQPAQDVASQGYTPEYGITGASFDPLNPTATKYTYGETPESQMRRQIATRVGETLGERSSKLGLAKGQLDLIKNVLTEVPAVSSQTIPFSPLAATTRGQFLHLIGTRSQQGAKFADIETTLKQAVPLFVQSVGNISSGRLNNQELNLMGQSLLQLPYLDDVSQQRRIQVIDQLLEKGGVPVRLGSQAQPSPFQLSGQPLASSSPVSHGQYQVGQVIPLSNGRQARVVGFYPDGEPDVEFIR